MSLVIYEKVSFASSLLLRHSLPNHSVSCKNSLTLQLRLCLVFCVHSSVQKRSRPWLSWLFYFVLKYPWQPPCLRIHLKEFVISVRACCYKLLIFTSVQIFVDLELESELRARDEDRGNGGQDCASDSVVVSETSDASIVPNSRRRRGSVTISVFGQVCWNITCTLL